MPGIMKKMVSDDVQVRPGEPSGYFVVGPSGQILEGPYDTESEAEQALGAFVRDLRIATLPVA